jgi:broad specificity phosphatase PhoE
MRIVLARHGHPDVPPEARCPIAGTELGRWCRAYDAVGLAPASAPPAGLRAAAAAAGCIVTSDLRRAIESAQLLAGGRSVELDSGLREVGFPDALGANARLSPGLWLVVARAIWLFDGCECEESRSAVSRRAARVVDRLAELADVHDSVVAVGHGWFNLFVGRELRRRQWRGPRMAPSGYWASAEYERERSGRQCGEDA